MIQFSSEKDMENFFVTNIDLLLGKKSGTSFEVFTQVSMGSYGVVDTIVVERQNSNIIVHVIEYKNTKIRTDHILQLARYKTICDDVFDNVICDSEVNYIGVCYHLVGLQTFPTSTDLELLLQTLDWVTIHQLSIDVDGIKFDRLQAYTHLKHDEQVKKLKRAHKSILGGKKNG